MKEKHLEIKLFGKSLTFCIIMALILGTLSGIFFHLVGVHGIAESFLLDGLFKVVGQIFLSALKFLVVPVVFLSLVCGVAALEDVKMLGWIGGKTLLLYLLTTAVAVTLAITLALIVMPGKGFNLTFVGDYTPKAPPSLADTLIDFVPTNPFQALVQGNVLQIIVMALAIGLVLSISGEPGKRLIKIFQDANHVIMNLVNLVMLIAPFGVFSLLVTVFAKQGYEAITPLAKYFFTVLVVLLLHFVLVYGGLLKFLGRLSPMVFFRKFQKVMVFAFSTSSSNATLPTTIETVEHDLGVKNSIASFTLPLGATINMDGTAIMQGVATLFISQAYGIDIGLFGYITVIATATIASIGTAGVPGVGLITLAMVLQQVQLPVEGIAIILGVDRLLDMARTSVNVTGDAVATCIVAKSEGLLDERILNSKS